MASWLKWTRDIFLTVAFAILLTWFFDTKVLEVVSISSSSMQPTIQIGERVMINKIVDSDRLDFGDIVVFYPPDSDERYIKRLVGLEGDRIKIENGRLYRNGQKVDEDYIPEFMDYELAELTVPNGMLFMLGDNRNNSFDSHLWSTPFVDQADVVGRAVFKVYPFEEAGTF